MDDKKQYRIFVIDSSCHPQQIFYDSYIQFTSLLLTAFVASDKSARGVLGWIYGDIHCSNSSRRNCSHDLMSSFSGWGMRGSVTTIAVSSSLSYLSWSSFCAWLYRVPTEICKMKTNWKVKNLQSILSNLCLPFISKLSSWKLQKANKMKTNVNYRYSSLQSVYVTRVQYFWTLNWVLKFTCQFWTSPTRFLRVPVEVP